MKRFQPIITIALLMLIAGVPSILLPVKVTLAFVIFLLLIVIIIVSNKLQG